MQFYPGIISLLNLEDQGGNAYITPHIQHRSTFTAVLCASSIHLKYFWYSQVNVTTQAFLKSWHPLLMILENTRKTSLIKFHLSNDVQVSITTHKIYLISY